MFAIAFDLGTTTIAGSLLELDSGKQLSKTGAMNPQRTFGADVVSRLQLCVESEEKLLSMGKMIRDELWRLTLELCNTAAITVSSLETIAIAGNPAMQHILLELPVERLAFPPYRPHHTQGTQLTAQELGWESNADVYIFPMPGGFVGGDTVAFLYGERHNAPSLLSPALYLDMGTNGEIALVSDDTIWATSAAAGPAFEGGNLSCGMVALSGAINSVVVENEKLKTTTIGGSTPLGICGSAAIQTIDQLLHNGIIEPNGRMLDNHEIVSNLANRVIQYTGENAFVLHRDAERQLLLTQNDIRQIQLAKSALRAGIEVLFERSSIHRESLSSTVLTGSFGAFLAPAWLKSIGIFDDAMVQTSHFTPEGALTGVEKSLLAKDGFAGVEMLSQKIKVVPLSGTPGFEKLFIQNINFPNW